MKELAENLTWYFITTDIKYYYEFVNKLDSDFKEKKIYPDWLLNELEIKPRSFIQITHDRFNNRLNKDMDFKRDSEFIRSMINDVYEEVSIKY